MMLTISGLPPKTKYRDLKLLIQKQCNLADFILDNLVDDNGFKKARVGLADASEGAHVLKCLSGYRMAGCVLNVTPIGKAQIPGPQHNFNQPHNDFNNPQPSPWGQPTPQNQWEPNPMPQQGPNSFGYQQNTPMQNNPYMAQQQNPMQQHNQNQYGHLGPQMQSSQQFPGPQNQDYGFQPHNIVQDAPSQRQHVLRAVEIVDTPPARQPVQGYQGPDKPMNFQGPNRFPSNQGNVGPPQGQNQPNWTPQQHQQNPTAFNQQTYDKPFNDPKGSFMKSTQDRGSFEREQRDMRKSPFRKFSPRRSPGHSPGRPGRRSPGRRLSPGRRGSPEGRRSPGRRGSPGRRPHDLDRGMSPRRGPSMERGSAPQWTARRISPAQRSPDRRPSPGRSRYSPPRHGSNKPDDFPDRAGHKPVRPAYEPNSQESNQAIHSGGYRPNVHEKDQYPGSGQRRNQPTVSPWQQERDKAMFKETLKKIEEERNTARLPFDRPGLRLDKDQKRSRSPRKSRSPIRRDKSPSRDRFKRRSPSPRPSWVLDKSRSPDIVEAPPPPLWPGQDPDATKAPEFEDPKPVREPVWEYNKNVLYDRKPNDEGKLPVQGGIRIRGDLQQPLRGSEFKREFSRDVDKYDPMDTFESKRPKFSPRDDFDQKGPKFNPRDNFDKKEPVFEPREEFSKIPKFGPRDTFDKKGPKFSPRDDFDDKESVSSSRDEFSKMPKFGPRDGFDRKGPTFNSRGDFDKQKPVFGPRNDFSDIPKFGPRDDFDKKGPKFSPRDDFDTKEPVFGPRGDFSTKPKFGPRDDFDDKRPKFSPREDFVKVPKFSPRDDYQDPKLNRDELNKDTFSRDYNKPKFSPRDDYEDERDDFRKHDMERKSWAPLKPETEVFKGSVDPKREESLRMGLRRDVLMKMSEELDKQFEDVHKRAQDFHKRAEEYRREDRRKDYDRRPESKIYEDRQKRDDDRRDFSLDDRRKEDWKTDEYMKNQAIIKAAIRAKKEKAVEEIAQKILDKHNIDAEAEHNARLCAELRIAVNRIINDMFGENDVSFIELVVKFNAKYSGAKEDRILKDVLSDFPAHFRPQLSAPDYSEGQQTTSSKHTPVVNLNTGVNPVAATHVSGWDMTPAMQNAAQSYEMYPQMMNSMMMGGSSMMMGQAVYQPVHSQPTQRQEPVGHNLYLCKDDFEPFTEPQADFLRKFLIDQIVKVTETSQGWAPDFTFKGLQSSCRYELHTLDEASKDWLINFDFSVLNFFNILVYTKEELWYERAAIWLPGHSRCRNIEPLAKLKLQNKKLEGANVGKWKFVKKIVTVKGTRVYVDMPPSAARALEKHKMTLSYELQKVSVFLKAVAIDKDAFDMGLKDPSLLDEAELTNAAMNSPMPTLGQDPKVVKICLAGNKPLTVLQARKIREMLIYHIFKYHQHGGNSCTDFVKYGLVSPGYLGILPDNEESKRWLTAINIGKLNRQSVIILGSDDSNTRYIAMSIIIPYDSKINSSIILEKLKQSNQGVKGINFNKWKPQSLVEDKFRYKYVVKMDIDSIETIIKMKYKLDFVDHFGNLPQSVIVRYEKSEKHLMNLIKRYKSELQDTYDEANMDLASTDSGEDNDIVCLN